MGRERQSVYGESGDGADKGIRLEEKRSVTRDQLISVKYLRLYQTFCMRPMERPH
jgi:hypothetical protein